MALAGGAFLIGDGPSDVIRKVDAAGTITRVAGDGTSGNPNGYTGDGGPATAAKIDGPRGIAPLPGGGFLFADDNNHVVRKVDAAGKITTVAGNHTAAFAGDNGPATGASISSPEDVALMPDGGFIIADLGNSRIRRVLGSRPVNTSRPKATGPAFPGSTLHCKPGGWAFGPTGFAYAWFRGQTKLATSGSYKVRKADQGRKLTCRVTASNDVGSSAPATSSPRGVPLLELKGAPKVDGSKLKFKVACSGARCAARATETAKDGGKTVKVGSKSITLKRGVTKTVTVRLNKKGRSLLQQLGKLPVKLRIALVSKAGKRVLVANVKRTLEAGP